MRVLIESDWNLKTERRKIILQRIVVLIESDWNLKQVFKNAVNKTARRINRIRLEFKGY